MSVPGVGSSRFDPMPQLAAEHSSLDSKLQQLHQKRFLSPDEEMEAVRLKKLKLHLKDAMRALQT